jgi:small-conductance mechanosensitive channel
MCFGGGSRATITKPDYNAYDKQFELQKEAIQTSMSNELKLKQQELQTSLGDKADIQRKLNEQIRLQAENTNAQAMRLAQVIGPPPPEKSAQAPVIGSKRKKLGKQGLRIRRGVAPTSSASGAGLNITANR